MNKDLIKQGLTIENIEDFVNNYGGEAIRKDDVLICRTICHNNIGEGHHKLYYYDNSHLFKCYTGCENDTFDIFELIIKIKEHQGIHLSLPQAIYEICNYFNLSFEEEIPEEISKDLKEAEEVAAIVTAMVEQRTALGLSQRDLATMCGIPQSSVARIESCKTTPNLGTLLNIFQHLGLKLTVSQTRPMA